MQGKNQFSTRQERTQQAKSQKPPTDVASNMHMYDFRFFLKKDTNDLHCSRWVVDSTGFRFSMASQIDHFTADFMALEEILERGQTNLNAPMWRWIRAQQKY